MNDLRKLQKVIKQAKNPRQKRFNGMLGDADGNVDVEGRANYAWVRLWTGETKEVFNQSGLSLWNTPVWVGYADYDQEHLRVLGERGAYDEPVPQANNPPHAPQHGPFGLDPLRVWAEQIMPWLVWPVGELTVRVYKSPAGVEDLDMTASLPASGAVYALIEVDEDGGLNVVAGTPVAAKGLLTGADIPAASAGALKVAAVALAAGQVNIIRNKFKTDIYDCRFVDGGVCRGGGGSGTGDMEKSVYDPQSIEGDAFDLALHTGVVAARKIEPLKVSPTTGLIVSVPDTPVYRSTLDTSPPYARWQHLTTTLNLSLGVPVSGARWVLVYLSVMPDSPTSLTYINGATVASKGDLTWNDIPGFTSYVDRGTYPLAAVALEAGQTEITENDIVDLRFAGMDAGGVIPRLASGVTGNCIVIYGGGTELDVSTTQLSDLLHADGSVIADYLTFDTTPSGTPTAEGTLVWNTDRETLDLIMSNGVRYQTGQELFFYAINQTGSAIADGACVMFDGSLGASGIIKCKLAVADGTYPSIYIMGIATEAIANGETGRITFFGEVHGYNTSGYAAGDLLYPDPANPGGLTNVAPVAPNLKYAIAVALNSKSNGTILVRAIYTMGLAELDDTTISAPAEGDILQHVGGVWQNKPVFADMGDPTGWLDPAAVAVTYDKTARTITLTGTLDYYWRGVKKSLTSPWTSAAHDSADGRYFLYTTDGTTFAWSTTAWAFDDAMIAIARKSTSPAYQFALRECHGLMPWQVHEELHETVSAYRVSGGGLTAGTYTENTASDAATTPGFDALIMADEDIQTTIPAWLQGTYTTLRVGAGGLATFDTAASFPFRSSGSYILVNNPADGSEAAATNNQYVNVYVLRLPTSADADSQLYRVACLQPQRAFNSLAAAQAEDPRSLSLGDLTPSIPEIVWYERITYILASGDANTGKCRIATGGVSYIYGTRMSQMSAPITPTAENVAFTPTGNISATNVQAALAEVDSEKDVTTVSIHAATSKATPVDADEISLLDSAATYGLKKLTWTNVKATLKTYFDGLYQAVGSYVLTSRTISTNAPLAGGGDLSSNRTLSIPAATAAANGYMSSTYAGKLDGIEASADVTDAGNVGSSIHGAAEKTTPADADEVALIDSAASNALKRLTWANLWAAIVGLFAKTSWTPTFTNLTVGNGTLACDYVEIGAFVHAQIHLTFGSTTSVSGSVSCTIPSGSMTANAVQPLGMLTCNDAGAAQYSGVVHLNNASSILFRTFTVSGSNIVQTALSSTVPFTWATGDRLTAEFSYIKA